MYTGPLIGYKIIINFGVSLDRIVSSKLFNLIVSIGNMETPGCPEDCMG